MKICVKAYAKVNLFLDITGKLDNGYHALSTVMQSVSLYDTVTLETVEQNGIFLSCDAPNVPTDERNTAFRAAELYYRQIGKQPEVKIHIQKKIPSQAGLGGGSADAAAVLHGLNQLYQHILSEDTLLTLCDSIGADVPFCFMGGTRLCLNKGEQMTRLPDFHSLILLAKPRAGISTKEAFQKFDSGIEITHPDNEALIAAFKKGEGRRVLNRCLNVFEQLGDIENGENIKKMMLSNGALSACLSGSGSAYFGCFDNSDKLLACQAALQKACPDLFLFAGQTIGEHN